MNRIDLLLQELDYSYDKEGWYPPLGPALAGLTAAQASWRPPGEAVNTIWETVNHLLYYKERLLERLLGNNPTYPAGNNDDTFAVNAASDDEQAWQATVARVEAVHRGIREVLAAKAEAELDGPKPENPLGILMANIIMHDAYHTGEIVQIRKLQGSWPARRSFD
jgi:uncharacterized damage-inducible protein DinB